MADRTSDPTGVIGCTEECKTTAMVCMLNHTIVEFRPNRAWRGEFGFDWLRVDDETDPGQVLGHVLNEPPYKDCITGSYKSGNTLNTANATAYNNLKTEYHKLSVNTYRVAPRNEYFIPWLNLYAQDVSNQINNDYKAKNGGADLPVKPPFEAELRLIINVQGDTKPKEIEFVYSKEHFTLSTVDHSTTPPTETPLGDPAKIEASDGSFVPHSPGKNHDFSQHLKISCIKEFSKDLYIDVWAHHYHHNQAELDRLEQENKQLNDTDIPALEQDIATLESEVQTLEGEITTQEAQITTLKEPVDKLKGEIAELEALSLSEKRLQMTLENLLQAHAKLSEEDKKNTEVEDFKLLNQPGEREKHQAEVERLEAEVAKRETEIKQKTAQLETPQKELNAAQAELDKKEAELTAKQTQIGDKQEEIRQHRETIRINTEEMNKMQGRSLAGKLCVCANDASIRKSLKVVCVNVKINISTSIPPNPFDESTGAMGAAEEQSFYHVYYQSLIYPEFIKNIPIFDRTGDSKFKRGAFVNSSTDEFAVSTLPQSSIPMHTQKEFLKTNRQYRGSNYLTAFFFDIDSDIAAGEAELSGFISETFKKNVAMYQNRSTTTFIHEGLHGLGLFHTHSDGGSIPKNKKYIYFSKGADYDKSTTNIIGYKSGNNGRDRYDSWHWQWKIMRDNI